MNTPKKTTATIGTAIVSTFLIALQPAVSFAQVSGAPATAKPTMADEDTITKLDAYVVTTATRSQKAVDHVPGAITLIGVADISHQLQLTGDATSVLTATIPGYAPASQALANTAETLRGRVALRLLDGIPQSTPLREGSRSGTFADMVIIERIEVINGASASEGLGAVGGIINYITKAPKNEGNETTINFRASGQFQSDSIAWKSAMTHAHKKGPFDIIMSASFASRGMDFDANGVAKGLNTSGGVSDSKANQLFLKTGYNFGANSAQRVQLMANRFFLTGNGGYTSIEGDSSKGIIAQAIKGKPLGGQPVFQSMNAYSVTYSNGDIFGGVLTAQGFRGQEAMRYVAEKGPDKQDPLFAPLGTLVEQSEINAQKWGLRSSWVRGDLFSVNGLELNAGVDLLRDKTQQLLALTNRTWVPPMLYTGTAPFAQLEFDRGPLTIKGGVRHENGTLEVKTYTTVYFSGRQLVQGGTLKYNKNIPNVGVIYRLPGGWSAYYSYSTGFSLPDVGIALRGIRIPNQSVPSLIDLQPVIAKNNEVGFTWRSKRASFGGTFYRSTSDFGSSLSTSPITGDYVLTRSPIDIKGMEFTGSYQFTKTLSMTALYSRILGYGAVTSTSPTDLRLGNSNTSPDKITSYLTWAFMPNGTATFGGQVLLSRDLNTGRRNASGGSLEQNFDGYQLFDASLKVRTRFGDIGLGIDNIFNKYYILFSSQPENATVIRRSNYWAGRGRQVSISNTIKF